MIPPMGIRPRLYAARVCAGNSLETPSPSSCRARQEMSACVPPADYNPGRFGETSPTQQKSHGALCSMALIGLGIYLAAMRVDAGSSC